MDNGLGSIILLSIIHYPLSIIHYPTMIFLQAAGGSILTQFLPLLLIPVVFYFFMIKPQMDRSKVQKAFENSLEKGKDIVTGSGIIGKINKIDGDIITLQISNNVFIKVLRSAIDKNLTETYAAKASES